jgi:hypothetical protein
MSGEVFMMSGGPVSWSSKKQVSVALSAVEAEYVALTRSAKQAMWMHSFLGELAMPQEKPAVLHCDNMGATSLAKDAKGHAHVKHIDIREHYCTISTVGSVGVTCDLLGSTFDRFSCLFGRFFAICRRFLA